MLCPGNVSQVSGVESETGKTVESEAAEAHRPDPLGAVQWCLNSFLQAWGFQQSTPSKKQTFCRIPMHLFTEPLRHVTVSQRFN